MNFNSGGGSARVSRSDHLKRRLKRARKWLMDDHSCGDTHKFVDSTFPDYSDTSILKVYMLVAKRTTAKDTAKSLSVYIGRSGLDGYQRAACHNDVSARILDTRTRPNAGKWQFCMWTSLPTDMRSSYRTKKRRSLSKLVQNYWNASHGLECKIKRGLEIISFLGLAYGVTPEFSAIVSKLEQDRLRSASRTSANRQSVPQEQEEQEEEEV